MDMQNKAKSKGKRVDVGTYHIIVCTTHKNLKKLRVVFDCSGQYANMRINTEPISGPDFANQIFGVLLSFRKEHVAFIADIKSTFNQVLVRHTKEIFYAICGGKIAIF